MTKKPTGTDANAPTPLPDPRPNVPIRSSEEEFHALSKGERFGAREILLSRLGGASQVHVNLLVIPSGKQSAPLHYHMREEEHFYVLEGRCVMRSGDDRHELGSGDYVCFPAGTGVAHAFENRFDADCTMLSVGPSDPTEICIYPDSGKAKLRELNAIVRWPQDSLDYWDGEPIDVPLDRE
ncbi:MAG: cupin domain-containing protein [Planctomycetota bacterium]|jgi:uncharacterized cupin superfamily protein